MPGTLSQKLRIETKDAHTRAERSGVMRRILRGDVDRTTYVALLRGLGEIYGALESALELHVRQPSEGSSLAFLDLRALSRLSAIELDLGALAGEEWRELPVPNAALEYGTRLRNLGAARNELLIAHAYLRYLGDLSGGQILRGIIARSLSLPEASGTAGLSFFEFPLIPDAVAFKTRFRDGLDVLQVNADAVIEEAQLGYAMHERLFVELDAGGFGGAS